MPRVVPPFRFWRGGGGGGNGGDNIGIVEMEVGVVLYIDQCSESCLTF